MKKEDDKVSKCLISVIVPVYNVEKYLDRCVKSLLNQSYDNLEIILVDDGSSDKSPELCDHYITIDSRIKVIHKINGGLSSARNAGIVKATGDYISFIDSDDWIALNTYEYCLNLIEENSADVLEFNYIMVKGPRNVKQPQEVIKVFRDKDILQYYMESSTKTGSYSVWRCLFPRRIIKNLKFREGKINEDIDFKYKVLQKCSVLVTTNQYKYYYFQTGESLSTGGLKKKDLDLYDAAEALRSLTENEQYGSIKKLGRVKSARTPFSLLSKIAYFGIQEPSFNNNTFVDKLVKEHRKNLWILLDSPIPFSRKVLSVLYAINFPLSKAIVSLLKKMR